MNFQLPAQWFSQLYAFRIAGQYRASQLMESMSSMSLLEYVELYDLCSDNSGFWQTISLPQLKQLIINGQFPACLKALSHMTVPPGCGLQIFGPEDQDYITDADILTASQVLARYCEAYFKVHIPTSIRLSITWTSFVFYTISGDIDIPPFNLHIEKLSGFPSMDPLFKAFLDCPLSKVINLWFEPDDSATFLSSDPNFSKFISLFLTLDNLMTNPPGLQILVEIPTQNDGVLIPSLKNVRLRHLTKESPPQIMDFLNWRQTIGAPIQVLTLDSPPSLMAQGVDLSALEQYSGLKVVCHRNDAYDQEVLEYICGSGTPGQIDFREERS